MSGTHSNQVYKETKWSIIEQTHWRIQLVELSEMIAVSNSVIDGFYNKLETAKQN